VYLYNANTKYEKYLSNQIANQVVHISQSALYNLGVIQEILESNKLTKANAEELEIGFKDMVMGVQSLSELGKELDRLKDFNYNLIVDINSEYATYVIELINQNNEIILNDAQVSNFAKMGELMHGYQKIIEKTLDVSGEVGEKGVSSEY
jgi:hypothetical protein